MSIYTLGDLAPQFPSDNSHWIAESADIIGDVRLSENVIVLFGAVLRGDNEPISIGAGSNVQEHCMLHTDPGFPLNVGQNVTIGHRAILHGCTVGDNSLIGMGATVLNGAKIGKNCLIGAGAVVTENKEIPDGSMVLGMPGKVVRSLDESQIAKMQAPALSYQRTIKRFKAELTKQS